MGCSRVITPGISAVRTANADIDIDETAGSDRDSIIILLKTGWCQCYRRIALNVSVINQPRQPPLPVQSSSAVKAKINRLLVDLLSKLTAVLRLSWQQARPSHHWRRRPIALHCGFPVATGLRTRVQLPNRTRPYGRR